jgi:hypothetical protein
MPEFAAGFQIADMKQWQQNIFNRVWEHFVTLKNRVCADNRGNCVMVNKSGNRCAFSCLLPIEWSEWFNENHYSSTASGLLDKYQWLQDYFGMIPNNQYDRLDCLRELQNVHDRNKHDNDNLANELRSMGTRWGVVIPMANG